MTISAVQDFLDKVRENEALQAELSQALEGENEDRAIIELGKSKGYEFSSEELWAEVRERQAALQNQESEDLSDDDLEQIAGGCIPVWDIIVGIGGFRAENNI